MDPNICNNCGGAYEYRNGRWICRFCGAYKPEGISNEEVTLLYTASQKLRLAEFDEAEQEFDDIVRKYPQNPNGYWGRLMSKYGIKYEEDFDERRIPTCYATSIESIVSDADYQKALKYADDETKAYYIQQAEYIERVRKEWVEKARKEKPYDIFICYKDSDLANGISRTQDSIAAQDLYIHLTNRGYRVFFSRESLRDKVGEKYEPYIFSALSTAKVMLVYGSKPEYITSTWLKNEWTRYEKRIKAGEKKPNSLLVACDGFSPNALPRALAARQCFEATQRSFYSDLDEAIERIIHEKKAEPAVTVPKEAARSRKKGKKAPVITAVCVVVMATLLCLLVSSLIEKFDIENPANSDELVDKGYTDTTAEPEITTEMEVTVEPQGTTDVIETTEAEETTVHEIESPETQESETVDPVEPDPVEPETAEPDPVEPETTEPDPVEPETVEPETVAPETVPPETVVPETAEPETTIPEETGPFEEVITPDEKIPMWDENRDVITHLSFDELDMHASGLEVGDVFDPGQSANWNQTIDYISPTVDTIRFWGWIGVRGEIGQFGYSINNEEVIYNDEWAVVPESTVSDTALATGADTASRMEIKISLDDLEGWNDVRVLYKTPDGVEVCLSEFTMYIAPETSLPFYTVAFVLDGYDEQPSDQSIREGETAIKPSVKTDEQTRIVWYTDSSYKNKFYFSTIITEDLVLYGHAESFDPMEPANMFYASDLQSYTNVNGILLAEAVNDSFIHIVPSTADPYYYPFEKVAGARYVAIRYRSADAVGADMQIYIASSGEGPTGDGSMLHQPIIADNEWHYIVFDTQSLMDMDAGVYDGEYISYFRFDPLEAGYILDENGQPQKTNGGDYLRYELPADCSIDISYIGFFHTFEAAEMFDAEVEKDDTHFTGEIPSKFGNMGLVYTPYADGESYCIVGIGTCTLTDIVIPETYFGKPVTAIASRAFWGAEIKSVTFSDNVQVIEQDAFPYCMNLTEVTFGKGLEKIGNWAFFSCPELTDVYYPGTQNEWNDVQKGQECISNTVNIHYNYIP